MSRLRMLMTILVGLIVLPGCHDRREAVTTPFGEGVEQWGKKLPYENWYFSFIHPTNLPSVVTLAVVEDGNIGRTLYRRLDPIDISGKSIGRWAEVIGGYGGYFNKGNALPVNMHFCWDSVIDKKAYETEIWFSQETWRQMTTPYPDPYHPDRPFYRNNIVIGLPPGGTVRVWLENNGKPSVLQSEARIITTSGDKRLMCKNVRSRINFDYSVPDGYDPFIKLFIKDKTYPYGNW